MRLVGGSDPVIFWIVVPYVWIQREVQEEAGEKSELIENKEIF